MADIDSRGARRALDFGKDAPRAEVALQATIQLATMLGVLLDIAESAQDIDAHLMQGMGVRMIELNSVVLSAVGDECEGIDSLRMRLYGRAMEVPHA